MRHPPPQPPPTHDVLAVTVGIGGVRARRTGLTDAADTIVDVPDAPTTPVGPHEARDLVAAVTALTARSSRPPQSVVWAVPRAWCGPTATHLTHTMRTTYPAARIAVTADLTATHIGALGGVHPGITLDVAATATVLATDLDQIWVTLDGWGTPLGGRGSGAWIGTQGLAAALRERDGVPHGSASLLELGRTTFGPEHQWPALAAGKDADSALTAFAPRVCQAAHHDPIARAIVEQAGEHLTDLLAAGAQLVPDSPLVAVGGLLYLDELRVALASALGRRHLFLVPGLGGTLEGARLLGEHLLSSTSTSSLSHHPPYLWIDEPGEIGS
ncbi:hypothetical protein KEM60_01202 [Austwickia sp. TVS 96-490-7B]|uniref:BadF/BadG/BcrA/BcrD ATPase family protein n=1 Tax=Austwickia sp. TVS 96-490-7B TaxID=2830843 RepID=UPI001C56A58D|nr:BadF/BadG/BcrA/BcrD ATPase family protein [Austwickia sp. TVS 96-490-7B]MBW3085010.1 hypothetical protein [Austwickia sp. TVS 96-490-7B]